MFLAAAAVVLALSAAPPAAEEPIPAPAEEVVLDLGDGPDVEIDTEDPGAALEPAALCRMRPQCDVDADCDAYCGAGSGDCVRARCPIRVCRC